MIFVLNRVRVWGAALHLPTQGYIEYPPPPGGGGACHCHYFIIVFASVTASNHLHVICQHFVCLTPLFKGHVACWNFTLREPRVMAFWNVSMVKVFLFDDWTPFGRKKVNYLSIASGLFTLSCHIIKFSFVSPSKSNTATKFRQQKNCTSANTRTSS